MNNPEDAVAVDCGYLCVAGSNGKDEESYANAALIAAAPELYEALKSAQRLLEGDFGSDWADHYPKDYEMITNAMAKARGEK